MGKTFYVSVAGPVLRPCRPLPVNDMNQAPLLLLPVLLLSGATAVPAQRAPGLAPARLGPLRSVLVDRPGDGNTWVLAPGYKARFGIDGVDFIPYFGAKAKRTFPLAFRLRSLRRGD